MGLVEGIQEQGKLTGLMLLGEITHALDASRLPYYIVGNYAIDAFTGQNSQSKRRAVSEISGDIDILTPSPVEVRKRLNEAGLKEGLLRDLHLKGKRVDLGINSVIDLSDAARPCLRYRSINIPLPREIFAAVWVNMNGIDFPTLPPETLIHLYTLSWHLGRENHASIAALTNWMDTHLDNRKHEEFYNGFHQFNEERRKRYPLKTFIRGYALRLKYQLASVINGKGDLQHA